MKKERTATATVVVARVARVEVVEAVEELRAAQVALEVEVLAEERPTLAATIGREVRVLVGVCFIRLRPMHYAVV